MALLSMYDNLISYVLLTVTYHLSLPPRRSRQMFCLPLQHHRWFLHLCIGLSPTNETHRLGGELH